VAAINARIRSAWASSFGTRLFRDDFGVVGFPSRFRCLSRRTQGWLTANRSATAFVLSPASHAASTRSRRSVEYGFMASSFGCLPVYPIPAARATTNPIRD